MQKEIKVNSDKTNQRLDLFLFNWFEEFSRSKIQKLIEENHVLVNGISKKASYKLREEDVIFVNFEEDLKELQPKNIPLDIKYEDDFLIVLNKPKNLLTHPTPNELENTLVNALLYHCGENLSDVGGYLRRGIVHRLDKNTAGLMLVAKTNEAHLILAEKIKEKEVIRKYLAVALGDFEDNEGTINKPVARSLKETVKMRIADKDEPNAKNAVTHFRVLERFQGATLLELKLETGRTHQIRLHLSSIGKPVAGDSLYGANGFKHPLLNKIKTNEQVLQSYYLSFTHPFKNIKMEFELKKEDYDKDLVKVLKVLRGEK